MNNNKDKNTKKDIKERFQKFDFDPQQINQNQIYNKITAAEKGQKPVKKSKRFAFAFAAVLGMLTIVVLVTDKEYLSKIDTGENIMLESDVAEAGKAERIAAEEHDSIEEEFVADIHIKPAEAEETVKRSSQEMNELIAFISEERAKSSAAKKEKASVDINVVAVEGGKEVPLENAYIWLNGRLAGKTDAKGAWRKEITSGKVSGKVVVKNYNEAVFEKDISAEKDGAVKVVVIKDEKLFAEGAPQTAYKAAPVPRSASRQAAPAPGKRAQPRSAGGAAKSADSVYAGYGSRKSESSYLPEKGAAPKYAAAEKQKSAGRISMEANYNAMKDESYKKYEENTFRSTVSDPLSTFSADVDAASYNIVRQIIMSGRKPNPDSVRIEEFLNYFDYSYPQPEGADPVSMNFEYTDSPWNEGLKLVKIGVKAKDIEKANLPASNLVFLIDISGSMSQENRLPLVKKSMRMLVNELRHEDKVSIVTYANGVNEILSGAKGSEKERIINIIESLYAGGGTSGSDGLRVAYETAKKNFIRKGNNRIILATDGDFNIGPRSDSELENQITEARDSGVFLSVLGYGMGNYKDSKMQTIANKGNGNYAYINDLFEARKTLVKEFGSTLFTVAKDVKLQVEFNPTAVAAYRLVGYEKRALNTQDFNDDTKDAGEMGAGHTVTVLYEIIPAGVKSKFMPDVEKLKYTKTAPASENDDILTLKLRYKEPDSDKSKLMERTLKQNAYVSFANASGDMRFAASVAQFGQILKDSPYKGGMTMDEVISTAKKSKGADEEGYRSDFVKMADMYSMIKDSGNERYGQNAREDAGVIVCSQCAYINTVPAGRKLRFCDNCAKPLK